VVAWLLRYPASRDVASQPFPRRQYDLVLLKERQK
jgi:hypothetical protein